MNLSFGHETCDHGDETPFIPVTVKLGDDELKHCGVIIPVLQGTKGNQLKKPNGHTSDSNVGWANVGPTSGRQYRRWVNVRPNFIAVWDGTMITPLLRQNDVATDHPPEDHHWRMNDIHRQYIKFTNNCGRWSCIKEFNWVGRYNHRLIVLI